jgi:pyridoxine 4-dehydrogenase
VQLGWLRGGSEVNTVDTSTIAGIEVSRLGLGTSRVASLGSGRARRDAARLLDTAADLGITFVDTADTYGSTASERWLGEVMQGRQGRFAVATKCGLARADLPGPLRPLNQPVKKVLQRVGQQHYLEADYVRRSIDASLRRLRRERIEIYFLHSPPCGVERREDVFEVLNEARAAGKIGAFGISSPDLGVISGVTRVRRCSVAQTAVNPLTTDALGSFLKSAAETGTVELIGNRVLIGAVLLSRAAPKGLSPAMADLQRRLDSLSAERGLSKAHLLLRHAAAVPHVRVVLTGTGNPAHLIHDAAALAIPPEPADLLA